MIYHIGDTIPLFYIRLRQGAPVTGLSVTVTITNAATGASLLASTALVEVVPGLYAYAWNSSTVTSQTTCVETYSVSGVQYKNTFIIQDDEISSTAT